MLTADTIGLYISAVLILAVYSFYLYKDNPLFHIAENAAIGIALANGMIQALRSIYSIAWTPGVIQGQDTIFWVASILFGGLTLARVSRKTTWLSRWPTALMVGLGVGLGSRGAADAQFVKQILAVVKPVIGGPITPLDNIVMAIFTLTIVSYFIFTKEHKGPLGISAKIARYAMMIAFGGMFGTTVMGRISSLGTRLITVLQALGLA